MMRRPRGGVRAPGGIPAREPEPGGPVRAGAGGPERAGHRAAIAFGIGIACFAAYQQFKLPVVLPVLIARYGYDPVLGGACMSVYALAGLLLSVCAGRAAERRGALAPVGVALAFLFAGSLLPLLAPAWGWLMLLGRGLEGIGFAVLGVCGPVIAHLNATPRQIPLVIGLSAMWIPVGQLSATGLAPLALATGGWTLLWWAGAAGCLVFLVAALRLRRIPSVALAPAPPAASAPAPSRAERASLSIAALIFGVWSGQYFAFMTWMPHFLVEAWGFDAASALVPYVVPVVLVLIFNLATGAALRAGFSLGVLMTGGLAAQAAVWWGLPLAGAGWPGAVLLVVYGVSAGIVPACLFGIPRAVAGASGRTAAAFGTLMTGRNLGVLVGPILLAQVLGSSGAWDAAWPIFGALTTVALGFGAALARRLAAGAA